MSLCCQDPYPSYQGKQVLGGREGENTSPHAKQLEGGGAEKQEGKLCQME